MSKDKLPPKFTMEFELTTIEHLGVKLYSFLPPVIGELVSNAWDADAEKWKAESARCAGHAKARANAAATLKARLMDQLIAVDQLKVEGPRFKVAVQRSAASLELLVPVDQLPKQFQQTIPAQVVADKEAIRIHLKEGGTISAPDGTHAVQLVTNLHLRIR